MDIQIRLATKTDMESILEMSKGIYNGHDYLPHVFLQWLDDPKRRIIVAHEGDNILGLASFYIVDSGKTVVKQALRVHPRYRGKGISTLLRDSLEKYVRSCFPSVERERYTARSTNVERLAIMRKTAGETLVLELGLVAVYVNFTNSASGDENRVEGFPSDFYCDFGPDGSKVKPLSRCEFQRLLEEGKLESVVRGNILIVEWLPIETQPNNISNGLVNDGDCLFASTVNTNPSTMASFSHGRESPRVEWLHWYTTIYACDTELLKIHIRKQLQSAILKLDKKPFIFSCFVPITLVSCAKNFLSDVLHLKYVDNYNSDMLLFEKAFVHSSI